MRRILNTRRKDTGDDDNLSGHCELEVSVDAVGDAQWRVHSRFRRPGADKAERTGSEALPIDLAALDALRDDDAGRGRAAMQ